MEKIDLNTVVKKPLVHNCEYVFCTGERFNGLGYLDYEKQYRSNLTIFDLINRWRKRAEKKVKASVLEISFNVCDENNVCFKVEHIKIGNIWEITFFGSD